jgi:hypothetical protein
MNYFREIPDEITNYILSYLDYTNLNKFNIISKDLKNTYIFYQNILHHSLINQYGYSLINFEKSISLKKPNFTFSTNKLLNCNHIILGSKYASKLNNNNRLMS